MRKTIIRGIGAVLMLMLCTCFCSALYYSDDAIPLVERDGFTTVVTYKDGSFCSFGGIVDAERINEYPSVENIISYEIFFGNELILKSQPHGVGYKPAVLSGFGSAPTQNPASGGYYSVNFDLSEDHRAFITGLTQESLSQVLLEIVESKLGGRQFEVTHLDFIDTEKVSFTADGNDKQLCWAASAADMLEYTGWADKAAQDPANAGYNLSDEDYIFEFFIKRFTDAGSTQRFGLEYFFNGVNEPQNIAEYSLSFSMVKDDTYKENNGFRGLLPDYRFDIFFEEQDVSFSCTDKVAEMRHALDLLEYGGYGVGAALGFFPINGSASQGGHAITVWGYITDEAYCSEEPQYYYALIVSDSDSDKKGSGTNNHNIRAGIPNRLQIKPLTYGKYNKPGWYIDYSKFSTGESYEDLSGLCPFLEGFFSLAPYTQECDAYIETEGGKNLFDKPDIVVESLATYQLGNGYENKCGTFAPGQEVCYLSYIYNGAAYEQGTKNRIKSEFSYTLTVSTPGGIVKEVSEAITFSASDNGLRASGICSGTGLYCYDPIGTFDEPGIYRMDIVFNEDRSITEAYYSNNRRTAYFCICDGEDVLYAQTDTSDCLQWTADVSPVMDAPFGVQRYALFESYSTGGAWTEWQTASNGSAAELQDGAKSGILRNGTKVRYKMRLYPDNAAYSYVDFYQSDEDAIDLSLYPSLLEIGEDGIIHANAGEGTSYFCFRVPGDGSKQLFDLGIISGGGELLQYGGAAQPQGTQDAFETNLFCADAGSGFAFCISAANACNMELKYNCDASDEQCTAIAISDGVETIKSGIFDSFSDCTTIILPSTVKKIEADPQSGSSIDIVFAGSEAQWSEIEKGSGLGNVTFADAASKLVYMSFNNGRFGGAVFCDSSQYVLCRGKSDLVFLDASYRPLTKKLSY